MFSLDFPTDRASLYYKYFVMQGERTLSSEGANFHFSVHLSELAGANAIDQLYILLLALFMRPDYLIYCVTSKL